MPVMHTHTTERNLSMKVAFTTSSGTEIGLNFRKSNSFTIWDINPDGAYYVTTISISVDAGDEEGRIALRADALRECAIVCAREINGPAAAKLISRNIHPLKTGVNMPVEEVIGRLQQVLKEAPAPWMRKVHSLARHSL
jgi:nitrogen fixation protein NifX